MKLSVIIVNYNVEHFLEQCLLSVRTAMRKLDIEVYVVDNNSVDGSVAMVEDKFPWVELIANKDNPGFSIANNQAIRICKGEYVLLLNPDTLVEEDTFSKVIDFMDQHPKAGGLGVKMLDGKGEFLPESKRGLPTPWVSFYKIFGISRMFKKSKRFNQYHLGHLSKDETHKIEILSGAFMLMRKSVLDEVGLLDEAFFMYGEDIDLSWRIILGGYDNYYFPETRIIHYKGESTKKGSLNYVFVFYNAMIIFAKKHFSEKNAKVFSFFINLAIYLRAGSAILNQFIRKAWLPFLDYSLILGSLLILKNYYEDYQGKIYDSQLTFVAFSIYSGIWLISVFLSGGYDKPLKTLKILKGVVAGSAIILIAYSLLPEELRFSRALILLGSLASLPAYGITRGLLFASNPKFLGLKRKENRIYAIVGNEEERSRVGKLLSINDPSEKQVYQVSIDEEKGSSECIGDVRQVNEIIQIHQIDEAIFCAKDITSRHIISIMSEMENKKVEFKIAPPESMYIIGSNSIQSSKDLFILDVNSVSKIQNKRNKRLLDLILSVFFITLSPLLIFIVKKRIGLFKNCFAVLFGIKTWVGFFPEKESKYNLPKLKNGVLNALSNLSKEERSPKTIQKLNVVYAKDYSVIRDINIIFSSLKHLGNATDEG